jgi:hypothetical protein
MPAWVAEVSLKYLAFRHRTVSKGRIGDARGLSGQQAYDAVLGALEDGPPLYPGSALREKTHVQIAVRVRAVNRMAGGTRSCLLVSPFEVSWPDDAPEY